MPPLVTRQDIANGAVSRQPRQFDKFGGKSREARVFFYFKTADVPEAMPHSLGRTPTSFSVVSVSRDGAPGQVYMPVRYEAPYVAANKTDSVYNFGRNYVVLACTTANTWAEVLVS